MVEPSNIVNILSQIVYDEGQWYYNSPDSDYWHWGLAQRSVRVAAIAELAATSFPGDIVEIGCERGLTSLPLLEVAHQYGRRFIAVDPWDVNLQACHEGYYEEWLERTKDYEDIIDIVRLPSQDKQAIKYLKERDLAFAFVDGWHTYEALLSDIQAVYHAAIICADDVQSNWVMMRAFTEGAGERTKIAHPWCKERYIL